MARSPAYPQFSLPQSIELVRKVYKAAHRAVVDTDTVLGEMGYSARSGRALAALGSLKQFGLIEGRDEKLRVTTDALAVLEPLSEGELGDVLKSAALKPELFAELHREFEGQAPSESVVRAIAIRRFGFTDTGAANVAKSYAETMRFVQGYAQRSSNVDDPRIPDGGDGSETENLVGPSTEESSPMRTEARSSLSAVPSENVMQFRLSPTSSVRVIFTGHVTADAIRRLITHLELSKEAFEVE